MIRAGTRKGNRLYAILMPLDGIQSYIQWSWEREQWGGHNLEGEWVSSGHGGVVLPDLEYAEMVCVFRRVDGHTNIFTLAAWDDICLGEQETLVSVYPFLDLMGALDEWIRKKSGSIARLKRLLRR